MYVFEHRRVNLTHKTGAHTRKGKFSIVQYICKAGYQKRGVESTRLSLKE